MSNKRSKAVVYLRNMSNLFLKCFIVLWGGGYVPLLNAEVVFTALAEPSFGVWQGGAAGRIIGINFANNPIGNASSDYLYGGTTGKIRLKSNAGVVSATFNITNIVSTGGISLYEMRCRYDSVTYTSCTDGFVADLSTTNKTLSYYIKLQTNKVHGQGDSESLSWDLEVIIP